MFMVIFEVRIRQGRWDPYLALAAELKPILERMDGFIDNERYASRLRPGTLVSLSGWHDEAAVIGWRREARHHVVQLKGRAGVFADYRLRVGEVVQGDHPALRVGSAEPGGDAPMNLCTVTEFTDGPQAEGPPPGCLDGDVFASITTPGQSVALASWGSLTEARSAMPHGGIAPTRHRILRVVRDYGMFDRREAPQQLPEAIREDEAIR